MLTTTPRTAPSMTASLAQSIALLSLSAGAVMARTALLAIEAPALHLLPPQAGPGSHPLFDPDGLAAPPHSLVGHILHQIGHLRLSPRDKVLAMVLIDALEPTGWLGADPAHLARDCAVPLAEIEAVLHRLQSLEPSGIFARSLSECLALQAKDAGCATEAVLAVLHRLPMLAEGNMAGLAKEAGLPLEAVAHAARQIRALNPKPGLMFAGPMPPRFPPDLLAVQTPTGWHAQPHPALPQSVLRQGAADMGRARLWHQAITRRADLGREVASLILAHQRDFIGGTGDLRALTAKELALATGAHIATINRVLKGTSMATPAGTGPLRNWMARPVQNGGPAAASVKHSLAALLQDPAFAARSDADLSQLLAEKGVQVARRTVAKYRHEIAKASRFT